MVILAVLQLMILLCPSLCNEKNTTKKGANAGDELAVPEISSKLTPEEFQSSRGLRARCALSCLRNGCN